jgi:hypothetical protein
MGYGPKDESLWLWLGGDKLENDEGELDLFSWDTVGHWAIGLGVAGVLGIATHTWWTLIPAAAAALGIRELVQFLKNRQAHLLDRGKDIFEGALGGLTAWGVWQVVSHFSPWGGFLW